MVSAAYAALWHCWPLCIYIIFLICDCFCCILFFFFFFSGIETPDRNSQWYQHLLTLFAIFTRAIPKGLTFGLCLYVFMRFVPCAICWGIQRIRNGFFNYYCYHHFYIFFKTIMCMFCSVFQALCYLYKSSTSEKPWGDPASLIPLFYISSFVILSSPVALSVLSFSTFGPFFWLLFP